MHPLRRAGRRKSVVRSGLLKTRRTAVYSGRHPDMPPTLVRITQDKAALLESFLRAQGGDAAVEGLRVSRETYDLLASDSFWLVMALVDGEPAGLATVARLPKADARVGFLFVDELMVLPRFRRRGVARALLGHVIEMAVEMGLAGVRLLVRPENEAARALYRSAVFGESGTIFCERRL